MPKKQAGIVSVHVLLFRVGDYSRYNNIADKTTKKVITFTVVEKKFPCY